MNVDKWRDDVLKAVIREDNAQLIEFARGKSALAEKFAPEVISLLLRDLANALEESEAARERILNGLTYALGEDNKIYNASLQDRIADQAAELTAYREALLEMRHHIKQGKPTWHGWDFLHRTINKTLEKFEKASA